MNFTLKAFQILEVSPHHEINSIKNLRVTVRTLRWCQTRMILISHFHYYSPEKNDPKTKYYYNSTMYFFLNHMLCCTDVLVCTIICYYSDIKLYTHTQHLHKEGNQWGKNVRKLCGWSQKVVYSLSAPEADSSCHMISDELNSMTVNNNAGILCSVFLCFM